MISPKKRGKKIQPIAPAKQKWITVATFRYSKGRFSRFWVTPKLYKTITMMFSTSSFVHK